jgi:hypothetical protein
MADDSSDKGGPAEATGDQDGTAAGAGTGGIDAGSPGGMGGVRAAGGTGTDRPPGGMSPLLSDPHNQPTVEEERQQD